MSCRLAVRGLARDRWPAVWRPDWCRRSNHVQASPSTSFDQDHAYPFTHPNAVDPLGRPLGPRPGDEAILTLSGGVDSSVAAYLAIVKGGLRPCRTIFMRNWNALEEGESFEPGAGGAQGCQWMRDWERVQRMAQWLNVEPELIDLSTEYWNNVFAPSLDQWQRGRTPNPDILCNSEIKFGELLRRLDHEEGRIHRPNSAEPTMKRRWLITGHYARVDYFYPSHVPSPSLLHGRLFRALDTDKDQSYFLSGVDSLHLGRSHFPLAKMHKADVRRLARSLGMPTAESEESMGLCFVGKRKRFSKGEKEALRRGTGPQAVQLGFAGFLDDYIDAKPGKIVTLDGQELGMHAGLHTLTVGQGAKVGGVRQRYFVAAKDSKANEMIVVPGIDHPMLQCRSLRMDDFHVIMREGSAFRDRFAYEEGPLQAQIRHRQEPVSCRAKVVEQRLSESRLSLEIVFDEPISSVAAGQVCALYDGKECVGSGVICQIQTAASFEHATQ